MKKFKALFTVALALLCWDASRAMAYAQFDCEVHFNGPDNQDFSAAFYGDNSNGSTDIINKNFELNHITANLRVQFLEDSNYLMIQLSQPGNNKLWLSSEGTVDQSKRTLSLVYASQLISSTLSDGLSGTWCKRR